MKKWILPVSIAANGLFTMLLLVTCNKNSQAESAGKSGDKMTVANQSIGLQPLSATITITKANQMILSYLNGIDYTVNANETRAWFIDADSIRSYLGNNTIRQFKVFLAHNMTYINGGHEGQRPQPNDNALDIIIAGVDSAHNIVLTRAGGVMDEALPCPDNCPPSGTAGQSTL